MTYKSPAAIHQGHNGSPPTVNTLSFQVGMPQRCGLEFHHQRLEPSHSPASLQQLSSEFQSKLSMCEATSSPHAAGIQNLPSRNTNQGALPSNSTCGTFYQPTREDISSQLSGGQSGGESMCCDDGFDEELSYLAQQVNLSDTASLRGQPMPYIF